MLVCFPSDRHASGGNSLTILEVMGPVTIKGPRASLNSVVRVK
jgi:hypothetical protein